MTGKRVEKLDYTCQNACLTVMGEALLGDSLGASLSKCCHVLLTKINPLIKTTSDSTKVKNTRTMNTRENVTRLIHVLENLPSKNCH